MRIDDKRLHELGLGVVLALYFAVAFLGSGCATAYLKGQSADALADKGWVRYGENMVHEVPDPKAFGGARAVNSVTLGEAARADNPVLYPLAWVLDYIGIPIGVGTAGYMTYEAINGDGNTKTDDEHSNAGRDNYSANNNSKLEINNYYTAPVAP